MSKDKIIATDFFIRIERLCEKKGISVTKLAEEIGKDGSAATGWRRGSVPRNDTIKAIADFFEVDVSYLIDGVNVALHASNFVQGNQNTVTFSNGEKFTRELSEIEAELLRICEKMTIKEKNELLTFAYQVVNKSD